MELAGLIRRGNIVITEYEEDAETGCYLGNGRFGAVMSGLGLNMSPMMQKKYPEIGQSQFTHIQHWGRFRFISEAMRKETCADYILPLFKLYWEEEPEQMTNYYQCHDLYDGTLETFYERKDGIQIRTTAWFDMENKNLAGIRIDVEKGEGKICPVKASAVTDFVPYAFLYKKHTEQQFFVKEKEENWCMSISCKDTINQASSGVYFRSTAPVEICRDGIRFLISAGKNEIFISYGEPVKQEDMELSFRRTKEKWHRIWEESSWFDFPEETAHKMWTRSLAYLISSYNDDCAYIQPTNGLTGNMFPFHFVQDLEYIAPALMMSGHVDIVKRWIEKFAGEIEEMRQYAKALWPEAQGIYPPWELPFGKIEGYHTPSVPVIYCYEPHNVGYLCRLAKEAAEFVNDADWNRKYAYPLIKETAEFYKAFCKKENGKWHLLWYPCIGQDEAGGRNKKDYLCSLYSAKYTFQAAVAYGLDPTGDYKRILNDELAFEELLSERGTYHTAQGADDFGKQKHPVQLDGVSYFAVEEKPIAPEIKAYELRHEITERAKEPFYFGWTLGQFLLSGSNMKDPEGWRRDWADMRKSDYTDSRWIQIYETSTEAEKSFYLTTHGMILQSLIRNYVNDFWGILDLLACPVFQGKVSFGNVRTRLGVTVSGTVTEAGASLELTADRDCEIKVTGLQEALHLKQGEKRNLKI